MLFVRLLFESCNLSGSRGLVGFFLFFNKQWAPETKPLEHLTATVN